MKKAKIGLGSYAYRWAIGMKDKQPKKPLSPLGLINKAVRHGFELVQIADNMPLQSLSNQELEDLSAHAHSTKLSIELGTDGISNGNALVYLDIASKLNAKLVRATLSHEDLNLPKADLIITLKKVSEAYEEAGVSLALENHFLLCSEALISIIERVKYPAQQTNLGICLDVANSIASHEWPETTIQHLAPYALNLHLKDYRFQIDPYGVGFKAVGVPLADGELDIKNVFETLKQEKRYVNVILEHWIPQEVIEQDGLEAEDLWTQKSLAAAKPYVDAFNARFNA